MNPDPRPVPLDAEPLLGLVAPRAGTATPRGAGCEGLGDEEPALWLTALPPVDEPPSPAHG